MDLLVVGAGHVGLVTAVGFARLGHRVAAADVDRSRIAMLQRGQIPIYEPGLAEALETLAADGHLSFTTSLEPPPGTRISVVCVSTPTGPDGPLSMAHVEAAVRGLLECAPADHVIVVRSTLPVDGPERLQALAAAVGSPDTTRPTIVTNPEFMREGSALHDFEHPNRVVVGWLTASDRRAAEEVAALYAPLAAPTLIADARSVALIKLASNVFLATKVAFANELARICDAIGADVDTVVSGIGLDTRIGRAFLTAGPGYGGSCLPEQAIALAQQTRRRHVPTPLIDVVSHSNETHQRAIVRRLAALVTGATASQDGPGASEASEAGAPPLSGCRIALLGLAFKAETDDVRESPALSLATYLRQAGATVVGYDPCAAENATRADPGLEIAPDALTAATDSDAIVVATEWREFSALDWEALAHVMRGDLVYDTRNVADRAAISAAGLRCEVLGRR